ncbi:hypothetical protein PC129_g20436 [Phytophthora cactorum]|uniref:Uncharacterized protein n=1 Tax=Phytophthora cactorum TaxID=29920 RepID=A0A8T1DBL5_9STRA|nr:hypothetical protein PC114_g19538 [Phytophthora cactorum]KAG2937390.1 hypothetical protein PC117_g11714 [Phytophthora cactorum]KAG2970039.1 hypothetical protein PC118_g17111 [Phytophthora cactorum]KAG3003615.1 hypothetical protein PC119_g15907 [Phytophthora cactorum]KAG3142601.1 hypothetical protein C6341_g19372 [Phytophthora cactorum]
MLLAPDRAVACRTVMKVVSVLAGGFYPRILAQGRSEGGCQPMVEPEEGSTYCLLTYAWVTDLMCAYCISMCDFPILPCWGTAFIFISKNNAGVSGDDSHSHATPRFCDVCTILWAKTSSGVTAALTKDFGCINIAANYIR